MVPISRYARYRWASVVTAAVVALTGTSIVRLQASSAAVAGPRFEAEGLRIVSSSGERLGLAKTSCPGNRCLIFASDGSGDQLTLALKAPEARAYRVKMAVKKFPNRGTFQLAIKGQANNEYDGTFRNLGAPQDLYSPSALYEQLDLGTVTFGTAGLKEFRFTMIGKNTRSSAFSLGLDSIFLEPSLSDGATTLTTGKATRPTTTTSKPGLFKPDASNTGISAGITLSDYTGPSTITADNTVIENKRVFADLRIAARNVVIRNSYLHCGSAIPASNTGCIDANSEQVKNLLVERTVIIPDHPSYYRDGIVGHEYTVRNSHISRTNDGLGIFNRPGGSAAANVTVEQNFIHDLTHWNNDPAHSDGTHNDGIQIQGGQNIRISGNNIVASVVAGDGLGKFGKHAGAGILVGGSVSPLGNVVIENNWLDDAQNTVCINNYDYPNITVTLRNNLFGHNQYDYGNGSKYPIRIYDKARSNVIGLSTNRWADTGGLLLEGRDSGIRYNR